MQTKYFTHIILLLFVLTISMFAQEEKRWSLSGTVGTTNDLSLNYDYTQQFQFGFLTGAIVSDNSNFLLDRISLTGTYYFDNLNNSLFIGLAPGIRYSSSTEVSFFGVLPFGYQARLNDDLRIKIATEGILLTEVGTVFVLGATIGVSIYL